MKTLLTEDSEVMSLHIEETYTFSINGSIHVTKYMDSLRDLKMKAESLLYRRMYIRKLVAVSGFEHAVVTDYKIGAHSATIIDKCSIYVVEYT